MHRLAILTVACAALVTAPAAVAATPPVVLPADAGAASTSTWLIGAKPGTRVPGARRIAPGTYVVARSRAAALAGKLRSRGELVFAEPDRKARRAQAGRLEDPLSAASRWREAVVSPDTQPPPVSAASPLLALIDSPADTSHPEWLGGNFTRDGDSFVFDLHGTGTAAVAAAPDNDRGILGIWPGMRAVNVPLPIDIRCSDSVAGVERAIELGAAVINMSYGSTELCFSEYVSLQRALARGIVVVAAAGNEFGNGNPLAFPASLPHVVTVAAIGSDLRAAFFSSTSAAVDLGAPGVGILTAVPPAFDEDGRVDGYMGLDGTSFAAPMVAAAIAWVRAARPGLEPDQVAQVVRLSARDVEREGYDPATGFGMLDIDSALDRSAPPHDPHEPNDDVVWIDGRAFRKADPYVWRTGRSKRTLRALLDRFEDPHDLYRIRLRGRSAVRIKVRQRYGDTDVEILRPSANSFTQKGKRIKRSQRSGSRTESLKVRNRSRRSRTRYVHLYVKRSARLLDAGYKLVVKRARF